MWQVAVVWLLVCAGCSGGSGPSESPQEDTYTIRALAVFYGEFSGEHGGRTPKSEAEFREFLATRRERLEAGGMDVDRLLTSPRSGAPWVIVCGLPRPLLISGSTIVAYEKSAVDGRRAGVNIRGGLESIEDAKLQAAGLVAP